MSTHVRLRVGGESYAFAVDHVQEVTRIGTLTSVPGSTAAVLGVFNLRGEIVPVYDLAVVLGIESPETRERLVVLESTGHRIALAVDDVSDVSDLPQASEKTDSPLLEGAAIIGDELVGYICTAALFETLGMKETA